MNALITKIKNNIALSKNAEAYLASISHEKTFQKGDLLITPNHKVNKVYYVINGCLRSFIIDKNGKEHTLQFAIKDWWISDYIALYNNDLSSLYVECLTASTVIELDAKKLEATFTLHPEIEPFKRQLFERHIVSLHQRILNQMQLTAAERYDLFLKQYPEIEKYTRNYHIASFLGITQESLSRIRIEKFKK